MTGRSRRWGHGGLNTNLFIYKSFFIFLERFVLDLPHPTSKGHSGVGKADCRSRPPCLFPHTAASAVRFGVFRFHLTAETPQTAVSLFAPPFFPVSRFHFGAFLLSPDSGLPRNCRHAVARPATTFLLGAVPAPVYPFAFHFRSIFVP